MWNYISILVISLNCVCYGRSILDIDFHLGLEQHSSLPKGEGLYLRDSFRTKTLIPYVESVKVKLMELRNQLEGFSHKEMIINGVEGSFILICIGILLKFHQQLSGLMKRLK